MVSKQDTLPFDPLLPPYTHYKETNQFHKDKGVMLASLYYETGKAPESFSWLHVDKKKRKKVLTMTHMIVFKSIHVSSDTIEAFATITRPFHPGV